MNKAKTFRSPLLRALEMPTQRCTKGRATHYRSFAPAASNVERFIRSPFVISSRGSQQQSKVHCDLKRGAFYSTYPRPTSTQDVGKRKTILDLGEKYRKGLPITMLTAKDYPSAVIIEQATGIDIILVGDSLGMVGLTPLFVQIKCCWSHNRIWSYPFLLYAVLFYDQDHYGLWEYDPCDHDRHAPSCQMRATRKQDQLPHW